VIGLINNFVITLPGHQGLKLWTVRMTMNVIVCESYAVIVFMSPEVYCFTALHCLSQKLVNGNYMHI
jgi:hypothetical protein